VRLALICRIFVFLCRENLTEIMHGWIRSDKMQLRQTPSLKEEIPQQ
jgi:hypothetical protein